MPLLLELALCMLARGPLLLELLLRRRERCGLLGHTRPQLFRLLGLLLGLALPSAHVLEGHTILLKLGTNRGHLSLPLRRQSTCPRQVLPRPLQRLVPVHECGPHPLNGRGPLRGLRFQLQEPVPQGFCPVRQPPVACPQGLDEGFESVALLPESAELRAHLVGAQYLALARSSNFCRRWIKTKGHRSGKAWTRKKQ
jgi:hypothetical protein